MTTPISIKKPNRMILEYDHCSIELVSTGVHFEAFIFYADEETLKRLNDKGVIAAPIINKKSDS